MLVQAEIDRNFSFHDLRHTHATLLLRQNINIKVISERLEHSTVTIDVGYILTLDARYAQNRSEGFGRNMG